MKVLCRFWLKDGKKEEVGFDYGADIYSFKNDYRYVNYGLDYFELTMYDTSFGKGYDCEAYFSQIDDLPTFMTAKYVFKPIKIEENKCECGKDSVPNS